MSYYLENADGFAGDFCTSQGIEELDDLAGPSLREFIETGIADEELAAAVATEVGSDPRTAYIADLLAGPAPFVIRDGIEEA